MPEQLVQLLEEAAEHVKQEESQALQPKVAWLKKKPVGQVQVLLVVNVNPEMQDEHAFEAELVQEAHVGSQETHLLVEVSRNCEAGQPH